MAVDVDGVAGCGHRTEFFMIFFICCIKCSFDCSYGGTYVPRVWVIPPHYPLLSKHQNVIPILALTIVIAVLDEPSFVLSNGNTFPFGTCMRH